MMPASEDTAVRADTAATGARPPVAGAGRAVETDAVYCMDALELLRALPDGSVDAVITDPPYSSGAFNESARRQAKGQGLRSENLRRDGWFKNDNMGTAGMVWLMRALACEASSILVEGGSLLVFCDWRMIINLAPAMESSGLRYQNMIVWNKNGAGLGTGFRPQHELVMHFVKGTGVFHALTGTNVITTARVRPDDKEHPTEKPVSLIEPLVRVVSPSNGLIVDPFAGSGSVLVAARNLGRHYIGSDLSEEYCTVARRRLAEPFTPTLFIAPKEDAVTLPMLFADAESEGA